MPRAHIKAGRQPEPSPRHTLFKVYTHNAGSPAAIMPADFNGTWILETNNQFEEYLKALSKKLFIWVGFILLEMLCVTVVVMLQVGQNK